VIAIQEIFDMRKIGRFSTLLALPLLCIPFASAQSQLDVNVGFGTKTATSSDQVFDTFGDGRLFRTPSLTSFFMGVGGKIMLNNRFGVGAEAMFQPHRPDYAGLKVRNTFYDVHGIYQPISVKRAALQLKAGIGGTNSRFYFSDTGCSGFTGCSSYTQFAGSSNHFQVVGGVGVPLYITEHIFLRPEIDVHYVPNFFQYGTNFVPAATVWAGYTFGER
jgi:hypothetical protein